MVITYCSTPEELFRVAADMIIAEAQAAMRRNGFVTLTLSGGSTPKGLYSLLAGTDALLWERVHLLWGDERVVASDSIDSNYRMANESLISHVAIPETNVHRVKTELGAEESAADYEATIRALYGTDTPTLDVVLLGVGPDGHTASLFPGQPQLESDKLVTATPPATREPRVERITMTFRLLNRASLVIFLVSGEEKVPIVGSILSHEQEANAYPASRVKPDGRLVWAVYPSPFEP